MAFLTKRLASKPRTLYVVNKRLAQTSKKLKVNHPEYTNKATALHTLKLKYRTENATKRNYLLETRDFDASNQRTAKYMKLLKHKKNQINHKRSIEILRHCENEGIKPNIIMYSKILDICSKCFAPNMVSVKLLEEMIIKYSIQPSYITFSSLLNVFYKNGSYHDCLILFGLTRKCINIDLKTLFKDYKKSREISYILNKQILVDSLKEIEINLISANILLKCFGKLGDMNKVAEFFQAMIKSNMLPNDVTLNSMINIYASNKRIDKMEKLFKWWLNNHCLLQFSPDIITINSMLSGYGKTCQWEKCEELFNTYCSKEHNAENTENLLIPTVITFCHIITCSSNCIDHIDDKEDENKLKMRANALKYYRKMYVIYGMTDYYNTCTTSVMNVCLKCNDLVTALQIFDQQRKNDALDGVMYGIAIRGLFKEGLIGEALNLFKEGAELNILKYLHPSNGPYSMDLHKFQPETAVIAIMHNLKTLCHTIESSEEFKIPTIWIVFGKGKYILHDTIPKMLNDERLFCPTLDSYIPHWNVGIMKIDDESLLRYIAFQLKVDPEELRPRFQALNAINTQT